MPTDPRMNEIVRLVQQRHALAVETAITTVLREGHSLNDLMVLYDKHRNDVLIADGGDVVATVLAPVLVMGDPADG